MSPKEDLTRREFLHSMAAAGLLAGTGLQALAQDPAADAEQFRFGLIGCGGQGRTVLLSAALRVPGMKCVAVCDIQEAARNDALQQAGEGAKAYTDWQELLAAGGMEGVIIATPLWTHAEIAVAALQAGYNVFCEKCMAYTVEQCKDMIRAQQQAAKVLQIGHMLRYHPLYHHAKRAFIKDGVLGQLIHAYCQWNRNADWRRPLPEGTFDYAKWGYQDVEHLVNWRLYKEYSGGLTTELASHMTDVVEWMLDEPPVAVTGAGGIDVWKDGRTVFDNLNVTYEYASGIKFTVQCLTSNAYNPYVQINEAWEMLRGSDGTLILGHLPWERPVGLFVLEPGARERLWMDAAHRLEGVPGCRDERGAIVLDAGATQGPNKPQIAGHEISKLIKREEDNRLFMEMTPYQLEMEEFKQCSLQGLRPFCDGAAGLRSAAAALFANQAMEQKARIGFPADLYEV